MRKLFLAFVFSALSALSFANDRPATGSFDFLGEGSLVVEFYRDFNPPTLHADKYVVFRLKDGGGAGEVLTADAKKCAGGNCWVRDSLKRRREFPSLRAFLASKYGSEAETRWQIFRADSAVILQKNALNTIATGKDRYYLSQQTRARNSSLMDPAPGVSYTVYLLEDCGAPVWGMLREIYDIDGGKLKNGTPVVTEKHRMLGQVSGNQSAEFRVAVKRVTLLVREYLNHYFAHKKN